ncbi:MAG: hypothetical protein GX622_06910 [Bacteroidales bacterium]|jgi:hypothetical protein|nr:hypothetical protein [Bacteroidales bacterium]
MKTKKLLIGLAIGVLIFSVSILETSAQYHYAGWVDRSDELPGMISDGEMLLIAGGAVLVIGGVITYIILKKKQDSKLESLIPDSPENPEPFFGVADTGETGSLGTLYRDICRTADRSNVLFFSRIENVQTIDQRGNKALSVGVRFQF